MSLRHRLRDSALLTGVVARGFAGWLRFCQFTTRWRTEGVTELQAALDDGPVILLLWHENLMPAMIHWSRVGGPLMSLHDTSPIGRLAAALTTRFGLFPVPMSGNTGNIAMSRMVKRQIAKGISIGITGDGPDGPRQEMKDAPLDWARATGAQVFIYASDMRRKKRLHSWDKMVLPLPFTRGAYVFRRWDQSVERRASKEMMDDYRKDIAVALHRTKLTAQELCAQG